MTSIASSFIRPFRGFVFLLALALCLILPGYLAYSSIRKAVSPSNDLQAFRASVIYNGALWIPVIKSTPGEVEGSRRADYVIDRIDLKSGLNSQVNVPMFGGFCELKVLQGQLHVITSSALFQWNGKSFEKLCDRPDTTSRLLVLPFVFDGRITWVTKTKMGEYQLVHLFNGEWSDGRKIILPRPNLMWRLDSKSRKQTLVPISQNSSSTLIEDDHGSMHVRQHGADFHIVLMFDQGFLGYRKGFQFADESGEETAQSVDADSTREAVGWSPIMRMGNVMLECDSEGPIIGFSNGRATQVYRQDDDGTGSLIDGLSLGSNLQLIPDDLNQRVFVMEQDPEWNSFVVWPIEGNRAGAPLFSWPGNARGFVSRIRMAFLKVLAAWILHFVILAIGAWICELGADAIIYEVDRKQADLALGSRRMAAATTDLILLVAAFFIIWQLLTPALQISWTTNEDKILASRLALITEYINDDLRLDLFQIDRASPEVWKAMFASVKQPFIDAPMFYVSLVVGLVLLLIGKTFVEGRWGITLGKLLFGIRTLRSSLEPIGFFRAGIRAVCCEFDFPFLLTPLPALLAILKSPRRRRIGDFFADAVVIRNGSIRTADWASRANNEKQP